MDEIPDKILYTSHYETLSIENLPSSDDTIIYRDIYLDKVP
jgi:hypothetical protein